MFARFALAAMFGGKAGLSATDACGVSRSCSISCPHCNLWGHQTGTAAGEATLVRYVRW